jgi:hypothetical protein
MSYSHPGFAIRDIIATQARLCTLESPARSSKPRQLVTACSYCSQVRIFDGQEKEARWVSKAAYADECAPAPDQVTHGICPDCYEKIVQPVLARLRRDAAPTAIFSIMAE